jgi:FMN phosphatase YigB (HAD superfamily)
LNNLKVVSFDLEGTLATPEFSNAVWHEGIPLLYAQKHDIDLDTARHLVFDKYNAIGDRNAEWYDIKYWFARLDLGDYRSLLDDRSQCASCYPDTIQVLTALSRKYTFIVSTNTTREFLPHLLSSIRSYFAAVFSSVSDYGWLKCPQFYTRVCREMNVRPHEVVHVGDSWDFDIAPARDAGLTAFHLNRAGEKDNAASLTSLAELVTLLQPRSQVRE